MTLQLPPNCKFFVDDVESEWTWGSDEAFDYIHGRGMAGSVADWPLLHSQVLTHLKPGGWYELQEYDTCIYSFDDPEMNKAPCTKEWQEVVNEAARRFGKSLDVVRTCCQSALTLPPLLIFLKASRQKQLLEQAGFVNVHEEMIQVPIGGWARNNRLKEIGRYQREHMSACVAAFTLAPLTRILVSGTITRSMALGMEC